MRAFLGDILCCAECRHFPLALTVLETAGAPDGGRGPTCELRCGQDGHVLDHDHCSSCQTLAVISGYFLCPACERFYFIADGIPRLLTEDFADLIDLSVPRRFPDGFAEHRTKLDAYLALLSRDAPRDASSQWSLEDIAFWEDRVYGDAVKTASMLEEAGRARPDAGNRTLPRERSFFRRLRSELPGGVMLDLGCGLAQTIRALCPPTDVGYSYIGADLSISALETNRRTLAGDFVQCTAGRAPFRENSVDAVLMLGTLHHLTDHDAALEHAVGAVRPGGWVALDEVVTRRHLTRRFRRAEAESAHNESVDPALVYRRLSPTTEMVVNRREYSPVRGLLAKVFGEHMGTRPWLTRSILAVDALCLATVGRLSPLFEGRELHVLARKHGVGDDSRARRARPAISG